MIVWMVPKNWKLFTNEDWNGFSRQGTAVTDENDADPFDGLSFETVFAEFVGSGRLSGSTPSAAASSGGATAPIGVATDTSGDASTIAAASSGAPEQEAAADRLATMAQQMPSLLKKFQDMELAMTKMTSAAKESTTQNDYVTRFSVDCEKFEKDVTRAVKVLLRLCATTEECQDPAVMTKTLKTLDKLQAKYDNLCGWGVRFGCHEEEVKSKRRGGKGVTVKVEPGA
jgi:hypothetical protein